MNIMLITNYKQLCSNLLWTDLLLFNFIKLANSSSFAGPHFHSWLAIVNYAHGGAGTCSSTSAVQAEGSQSPAQSGQMEPDALPCDTVLLSSPPTSLLPSH